MLTNSYDLTKAQQKKLKIQAKWGSQLVVMLWKGYLAKFNQRLAQFSGTFNALQQLDSSFKGETTLFKGEDNRFMGFR